MSYRPANANLVLILSRIETFRLKHDPKTTLEGHDEGALCLWIWPLGHPHRKPLYEERLESADRASPNVETPRGASLHWGSKMAIRAITPPSGREAWHGRNQASVVSALAYLYCGKLPRRRGSLRRDDVPLICREGSLGREPANLAGTGQARAPASKPPSRRRTLDPARAKLPS